MLISTRTAKLIIGAIEISGLYFISSVTGGALVLISPNSLAMMIIASITMLISVIMIATRRTRGNSGNIALIVLSVFAVALGFLYRDSNDMKSKMPDVFIVVNACNAVVGAFGIFENKEKMTRKE